jgi:3-deoxy-D-manno-octulosonic acid kinase
MHTTKQFISFGLPGRYRVGTRYNFGDDQKRQLLAIIEARSERTTRVLNGRGNVLHTEIAGVGKVVVKRYMRGGLLRYLIRKTYFRHGMTRAEREFLLLEQVRGLGVNAPEPIAFAHRGILFYDAWLVTREIQSPRNLAELSLSDEDAIVKYVPEIIRQISILIRNGIFHVDLHPGNVVVDDSHRVHLLDFDKAHRFNGTPNALRDAYLVRWRRAVIKHHLPESLSERVCPGLRQNFEVGADAN